MLSFRGQLDYGTFAEVPDFHPLRKFSTAGEKLGEVPSGSPKLLSDLAVGDLETAHGRSTLLRVVRRRRAVVLLQLSHCGSSAADVVVQGAPLMRFQLLRHGIGHGAGWVVGFHLVIGECVEQELFAQILKEVLLPPSLKHAEGHFDIGEIPSAGNHLGNALSTLAPLVSIVGQTHYLP